jgi:hypothetical protein
MPTADDGLSALAFPLQDFVVAEHAHLLGASSEPLIRELFVADAAAVGGAAADSIAAAAGSELPSPNPKLDPKVSIVAVWLCRKAGAVLGCGLWVPRCEAVGGMGCPLLFCSPAGPNLATALHAVGLTLSFATLLESLMLSCMSLLFSAMTFALRSRFPRAFRAGALRSCCRPSAPASASNWQG